MKKLDKELKGTDKYKVCVESVFVLYFGDYLYLLGYLISLKKMQNEQYRAKLKSSNERSLSLIKAAIDIVVAAGLLQLSPKKVTPRVTGAFGFASSLISCYQVQEMSMQNDILLELCFSIVYESLRNFKVNLYDDILSKYMDITTSWCLQLLPSPPKTKTP